MNQKKMDVLLETVNYCNLRCPACPWHSTMTRKKHALLPEEFERIFKHISSYTKSICFYVMGEPLLNQHLFEYVLAAHKVGIHTGFSTNGMLLKEHIDDIFNSGLDFIQIAVDGLDPETHEGYRIGSDFHLIVENIRLLVKKKKKRGSSLPEIRIQTLISRRNEYRIPEFQVFADELGVQFVAKKMMFGKTEDIIDKNRSIFEPEQQKYQRLNNPDLLYYKDMLVCPQLKSLTILCNGDVVPCCFDYDGKVVLGNLIHQTLPEIMNGDERKKFCLKGQTNEYNICSSCDMAMEKKIYRPSAILFDYGRTLVIMPDIDIRKGICALLVSVGLNPTPNMVERYFEEREKFVAQMCSDTRRRSVYPESKVMEHLFKEFHIETSKSSIELEHIFSDGCSLGKPTNGSAEFLDKLCSLGIRTGIITNNRYSEETVRWKMKKLFPDHDFDVIVSSAEANSHKPDKRIFETALERLQMESHEMWFVGDSLEDDMNGALRMGMMPFWYIKYSKLDIKKIKPCDGCHMIHDWNELEKILDGCVYDNTRSR